MSKLICSSAIEGAIAWVARAEARLDEAVAAKGESCAVGFPATAYFLPVIYSFTGEKMQTLADLRRILDDFCFDCVLCSRDGRLLPRSQ